MYTFVAFESFFEGHDWRTQIDLNPPNYLIVRQSNVPNFSSTSDLPRIKGIGATIVFFGIRHLSSPRHASWENNQRPSRSLTIRWMYYNSFGIFYRGLSSRCGIGKVATRILPENCLCSKSSLNCYLCGPQSNCHEIRQCLVWSIPTAISNFSYRCLAYRFSQTSPGGLVRRRGRST
jgi:hypothetical protein